MSQKSHGTGRPATAAERRARENGKCEFIYGQMARPTNMPQPDWMTDKSLLPKRPPKMAGER